MLPPCPSITTALMVRLTWSVKQLTSRIFARSLSSSDGRLGCMFRHRGNLSTVVSYLEVDSELSLDSIFILPLIRSKIGAQDQQGYMWVESERDKIDATSNVLNINTLCS